MPRSRQVHRRAQARRQRPWRPSDGQYNTHVFVCTSGDSCPTQGNVEQFVKYLRDEATKAGLKDRCQGQQGRLLFAVRPRSR